MPGNGSIRIIGGAWRGRRINVVNAHSLRPTPSRLRETLFNWWRERVPGARVLDLFAGTGALGFEAASRGAAHVAMVEKQGSVCRNLQSQVESLGAADKVKVYGADVLSWLHKVSAGYIDMGFDLVCMDPPFLRVGIVSSCCELLLSKGWLNQGAMVYAESPEPMEPPNGFSMLRQSRAGQVHGCMWQYNEAAAPGNCG